MARALAIAAVLAAHSGLFFARFWRDMNSFSFWSGVFGVELFFVLSGLLIGKILFRDVLPHCSFRKMGIFFLRRWMRTLPAYYAVLALLVIYAFAAQAPLPHIWRYAAFLQNCPPEYAAFFPVSWSLSVEQWAYIAIPPLLLTAAMTFAGTLFFSALSLLPFSAEPVRLAVTVPDWMPAAAILYLGIAATFGGYGLYNYGIARLSAGRAAAYTNLIPVITLFMGVFCLNEHMTPAQYLASVLVVAGVMLSQSGRALREEHAHA